MLCVKAKLTADLKSTLAPIYSKEPFTLIVVKFLWPNEILHNFEKLFLLFLAKTLIYAKYPYYVLSFCAHCNFKITTSIYSTA